MANEDPLKGMEKDGKLFGVIPKMDERYVAFAAAILGIIMFALYMRTKNSAASATTTDTSGNASSYDSGGYSDIPSGSASGSGNSDGSSTDPNDATFASDIGTLQTSITSLQNSLASLATTQAAADTSDPTGTKSSGTSVTAGVNSGASLAYDFSNEFTSTTQGATNTKSSTTTDSSNSGSGGLFGDLFGGGNSTSNSVTGSSESVTGASTQTILQQNATASASNLDQEEYNALLNAGTMAANNNLVASEGQTGQAPFVTSTQTPDKAKIVPLGTNTNAVSGLSGKQQTALG